MFMKILGILFIPPKGLSGEFHQVSEGAQLDILPSESLKNHSEVSVCAKII